MNHIHRHRDKCNKRTRILNVFLPLLFVEVVCDVAAISFLAAFFVCAISVQFWYILFVVNFCPMITLLPYATKTDRMKKKISAFNQLWYAIIPISIVKIASFKMVCLRFNFTNADKQSIHIRSNICSCSFARLIFTQAMINRNGKYGMSVFFFCFFTTDITWVWWKGSKFLQSLNARSGIYDDGEREGNETQPNNNNNKKLAKL